MRQRTIQIALLIAALVLVPLAAARPARAEVRVDIGFFYDSLAPYGSWFELPAYGWVWAPNAVSLSWQPYRDGRWVYANGYGWTWASFEPWGWATDHYGRWLYDDYYGWVWMPGYEWAPAWVDWVSYDGWLGWAPLPPAANWSVGSSFTPRHHARYDCYTFVEPRYLGSTAWRNYAAPRDRATRWARDARRITRYQRTGDRVVNRSVAYVPRSRVNLVDVRTPRSLHDGVSGGQVTMFRPDVGRNRKARPPRRAIVSREARAKAHGRAHGHGNVRPQSHENANPPAHGRSRVHRKPPAVDHPAARRPAPRAQRAPTAQRRPAVRPAPQRARAQAHARPARSRQRATVRHEPARTPTASRAPRGRRPAAHAPAHRTRQDKPKGHGGGHH